MRRLLLGWLLVSCGSSGGNNSFSGADGGDGGGGGGNTNPPVTTCGAYAPGPDLMVCGATYLGGPAADAITSVAVAKDGSVLAAGKIEQNDFGKTPAVILGGTTGALLRLDPQGRQALSITRAGTSVTDVEVSTGDVVICGDFGVAVLDETAVTVKWSKPGNMRRCSIAPSGKVAALGADRVVSLFDAAGAPLGQISAVEGNVVDVAAGDDGVYVAGWSQKNKANYCMAQLQVAALYGFGWDGKQQWKDWGFEPEQLASNGSGQCADTRAHAVAIGRDGGLYFAGHSAGGNSMFSQSPRDVQAKANNVKVDMFSDPYNTSSNHITYYARLDPKTGDLVRGQWLLTRLSSGKGNTIEPRAIAADEKGNVYLSLDAASGIADGDKLKISGAPVGAYKGGPSIAIIASDFKSRLSWNTFQSTGGAATSGIAVARGVVAFSATQSAASVMKGELLTVVAPIQTKPAGDAEGFVAALPGP